jgi:hypothetical protein
MRVNKVKAQAFGSSRNGQPRRTGCLRHCRRTDVRAGAEGVRGSFGSKHLVTEALVTLVAVDEQGLKRLQRRGVSLTRD